MHRLVVPNVEPASFRAMAKTAIDAAVTAGATYADIRLGDRHVLSMAQDDEVHRQGVYGIDRSYGIRVCVNGLWGFGYGIDPTPANVVVTARSVVADLLTLPATLRRPSATRNMAAIPVVPHGEWATPVQIDPFTVSPDDHFAVMYAYARACRSVSRGEVAIFFRWIKDTRVFSSSEGTMQTQQLIQVFPQLHERGGVATATGLDRSVLSSGSVGIPASKVLGAASAGFEIVGGAALQERFKALAEDDKRWSRYPETWNYPVGRYDAVCEGRVTGELLAKTLLPALQLDRLIGHEAGGSGTSYLAPIAETLGAPVCSPNLTLMANRPQHEIGGCQWDDEGVAPEAFPVITAGRVVDVFGSRRTLAELSMSLKPHGCGMTDSAIREPMGGIPNITMVPGMDGDSVEELAKGLGNGLLIRSTTAEPDPSRATGMLSIVGPEESAAYEVKRGHVTRRVMDFWLLFRSKKLWASISAVGSAQTVHETVHASNIGQPPTLQRFHVASSAVVIKDLSLIYPV